MAKLKNGSTEPMALVKIVAAWVQILFDDEILKIMWLVAICRGSRVENCPRGAYLENMGLVRFTSEGIYRAKNTSIKNIVLSSIEGAGSTLTIVNPIDDSDPVSFEPETISHGNYETVNGKMRRRIVCSSCTFGDAPTFHRKILCRIDMPHKSEMMEMCDTCDRYQPAGDRRY